MSRSVCNEIVGGPAWAFIINRQDRCATRPISLESGCRGEAKQVQEALVSLITCHTWKSESTCEGAAYRGYRPSVKCLDNLLPIQFT